MKRIFVVLHAPDTIGSEELGAALGVHDGWNRDAHGGWSPDWEDVEELAKLGPIEQERSVAKSKAAMPI